MARVKLTEYRAKACLFGEQYTGIALHSGTSVAIKDGSYVVKVDQGVKKRFKQGLVALNQTPEGVAQHVDEWATRGFSQFVAEPMFAHEANEERYFSVERVRDGFRILYARDGGVDIEAHPEAVETFLVNNARDVPAITARTGIPEPFLTHVIELFDREFFAFLEINPLIVRNEQATALDAAALVDSAGAYFAREWSEADLVKTRVKHETEAAVELLAATTPASLKLNVINPDGALFFLLSGGGGSIVIADQAQLRGAGNTIANYGEYSGGPTREETYLYTKEIVRLMLQSPAPKKALVIAGGVANFTDVKATFAGIIDALTEEAAALRASGVRVFVRRGGPNEESGLEHMHDFLAGADLLGSVHGSEVVITTAVDEAIDYIS